MRPWSPCAADGKQDLVISFRGTVASSEWLADFDAFLIEAFPWRKVGSHTSTSLAWVVFHVHQVCTRGGVLSRSSAGWKAREAGKMARILSPCSIL